MRGVARATVLVLLCAVSLAPVVAARRRAVRIPPSNVVPQLIALAAKQVVVTNHALAPALVTVCAANCITDVLLPGTTKEYDLTSLGASNTVTLSSDTDNLEARTETMSMIRITSFSPVAQAVPIVDLTRYQQTLLILSRNAGVVEIARRAKNGVQEDVKTYEVAPGLTRIPNPYGVAGSHEQLEVRPSVAIATLLEVTNATTSTHLAGKRLDEASGTQFLTSTKNATVWVKAPQGIFHGDGLTWPSDQDNTNTFVHQVITTMPEGIANTTLTAEKQSSFEVTGAGITPLKFVGWGIEGTIALPFIDQHSGATARSSLTNDTAQRYQMSFNKNGKLTILNTTSNKGNVSGTILSYDTAGNQTGSQDYTLGWKENRTLDVTATRTIITVKDAVGSDAQPRVIGTMQNGNVVFGPYQMVKSSKVTGEEYVQKWLDPLKEQYFFLSNAEVRCMINGNCGVRSYAAEMAALIARRTNATQPRTPAEIETILQQWADNDSANDELYAGFDPLNTDMRAPTPGVRFYFQPTGTNVVDFHFNSSDAQQWYKTIRDFLIRYTNDNPARYGGSTATGPDLSHNPTWSTQDANPPASQRVTGEEVVKQYLDPFKGQSFFFDNKMVRCMNTGDCGVLAIKSALASTYTRGLGETWSQAQFENWLSTMANGITSNTDIELWTREDPLTYSGVAGVSYMLTTTQDTWTKEPGNINLQGADINNVYQIIRGFAVQYIDTHPELFGGNQETGPSKDRQHYTTFYTRDDNPPAGQRLTGEEYVQKWLSNDLIWLSDREARYIIQNYKRALATEMNNTPGSPGIPFMESLLTRLIDGTYSNQNEELDPRIDNTKLSPRSLLTQDQSPNSCTDVKLVDLAE